MAPIEPVFFNYDGIPFILYPFRFMSSQRCTQFPLANIIFAENTNVFAKIELVIFKLCLLPFVKQFISQILTNVTCSIKILGIPVPRGLYN